MFERLRFSLKLLILAAVFLLPLAIFAYELVYELSREITFVQTESAGSACLRPTLDLIQHLQQHRGAASAFLRGEASVQDVMRQKQAAIVADFAALTAQDQACAERFRAQTAWAAIPEGWQALQGQVFTLTSAESFQRHTDLIEQILDYRLALADASNLTLDPEIDTYYLMQAAVINYPTVAEYVGQTRAIGSGALAAGRVTTGERVELASLRRMAQAYLKTADDGLANAFAAVPALGERLQAGVAETHAASEAFFDLLENSVVQPEAAAITSQAYYDAATQAIDRQYALMSQLTEALDERLAARLTRLTGRATQYFWTATLPLLVALWLFTAFFVSATGALRSTAAATRQIAEVDLPPPGGGDGAAGQW